MVDDDPTVTEVVTGYLKRAGYAVEIASDGSVALELAARWRPDLVVLDLMLPGIDGLEVCRRMRETGPLPVVMLTALGEEEDRVVGLESGADDYLTKPFSPRELVLRVRSVLRRVALADPAHGGADPTGEVLTGGELRLDLSSRVALRRGEVMALRGREFDLLAHLMRHPSLAFSRLELLEAVWGWSIGDQSTVTVHIRRLREKIEDDPAAPRLLVTVWGTGYRFDPAPGRTAAIDQEPDPA